MSRTPQAREIDGVRFEVTPLGFKASKSLFVRLSKALGPALAHAAQGAQSLRAMDLAAVVESALEGVSEADLDHATDVLGEVTRYSVDGGRKMPFLSAEDREILFAGRMLLFFQWIGFALEVQYADFFGAFRKAKGGAPAPATLTP